MAYGKPEIPNFVPFDIDFFDDTEIVRLRRRFKSDGMIVYQYVAFECYKSNGYYCEENDDLYGDIEEKFRIKLNKIRQIMKYCIDRTLFVRIPVDGVTYLTAGAIQRRWMRSVAGRISKRVRRGGVPFELNASIWFSENLYPEYFYLGHPFLEMSETNESLSGTKKEMSGIKSGLSTVEEEGRKKKENIESRNSRESLAESYGHDCINYYESRVMDYYNCTIDKVNYQKVLQFLLVDRKNGTGFFYRSPDGKEHKKEKGANFEQRKYDYDAMQRRYIEQINGKNEEKRNA